MPAKVAISCNRKEEGKETKGTGGQERDGEEDFRIGILTSIGATEKICLGTEHAKCGEGVMPAKVAISCNRKEEGKETKGTGAVSADTLPALILTSIQKRQLLRRKKALSHLKPSSVTLQTA